MGKSGKRKALPMELIGKKENRMVSLSKRRKGLMKKAEEFHSITGSAIAVYGGPSSDSVLHRFHIHEQNNGILLLSDSHSHSHSHTAPQTLLIGDQGSNQQHNADFLSTHADPDNNVVVDSPPPPPPPADQVVYQGGSKCEDCTTTTTTTPENTHVAALEPWRTWVDQKIRACQSIDDMVALKHHFSHLKHAADSRIVHSYLKTIENFLVFDL